jgi:hypothetical protein
MEEEKAIRLLLRQLKDIQAQAEKVTTGEDSDTDIENFSRYSSELKEYISKNVSSAEIRSYLNDLPEINYTRSDIKLWHYFIFPMALIEFYQEYHERNRVIQEINHAKSKYATLELLVRGYSS